MWLHHLLRRSGLYSSRPISRSYSTCACASYPRTGVFCFSLVLLDGILQLITLYYHYFIFNPIPSNLGPARMPLHVVQKRIALGRRVPQNAVGSLLCCFPCISHFIYYQVATLRYDTSVLFRELSSCVM